MRIRGQTSRGRQIDRKARVARDTLNTFTELTETYRKQRKCHSKNQKGLNTYENVCSMIYCNIHMKTYI